jgi:type II secretory pathway pseudopilin PulG
MTDKFRSKFVVLLWLLIGISAVLLYLPSRVFDDRTDRVGPSRVSVEMAGILNALQEYKSQFGQYPSGDSASIFRALQGQNPQKTKFLEGGSNSLDSGVLDPWGTPYEVYISGKVVLIRSAGHNKRFEDSGEKGYDDYIKATDDY